MAVGVDAVSDLPPADNIVDLRGVLERKSKPRECQHDHLEIDEANRRLTCTDCNREIDPYQALVYLAGRTSEWQIRWENMRKDYKNLANYVPHLRAVRELEGMWRGKRLPMCPHCKTGVTAESLVKMGWVHQSYAQAVAEHKKMTAVAIDPTPLPGGAP